MTDYYGLKGNKAPSSPPTFSDRSITAGHAIRAFAELPPNLRKKIAVEPGGECNGCWLWSGYVRKERRRFRYYSAPADYGGFRNSIGSIQGDRAIPEVRDPQKGKTKVAAHRLVYARLTGVHIDDVPTLARCLNERCVSPHHVLETGPTPKEIRRRAAEIAEGISFEDWEAEAEAETKTEPETQAAPILDAMETLKSKRPAAWVEREGAEIECELPPGSITPEIWYEYIRWDHENPEDDEDPEG